MTYMQVNNRLTNQIEMQWKKEKGASYHQEVRVIHLLAPFSPDGFPFYGKVKVLVNVVCLVQVSRCRAL